MRDDGAARRREALLLVLGGDDVAEVDAQGRLVHAGPRLLEALGHAPGAVLGKPVFDFVHPDDRAEAAELAAKAARAGTAARLVLRVRSAAEAWHWLELTSEVPRGTGEARSTLWVGRDVSDRIAAEVALRTQLEVESQIAELAGRFLAMGGEEFAAAMESGLERAAKLAGADRAQFFAMSQDGSGVRSYFQWAREGLPPRAPSEALEAPGEIFPWSTRLLLRGEVLHIPRPADLPPEAEAERRSFAAEGTRSYIAIPIRHDGRAVGFLDFFRVDREAGWSAEQITRLRLIADVFGSAWRRQRVDACRRQSEERLRALTQRGGDTICEMSHDGALLYISPNAIRLTGHTFEDLRGIDLESLVHPEDRKRLAIARRSWPDVDALDETVSCRVRHVDGSWRWLEANVCGFRTSDGEPRFALVIRDETDRHERRLALELQLEIERRVAAFSRDFFAWCADSIDEGIRKGLEAAAGLAKADRAFLVSVLGDSGPRAFDWHAEGIPPRPKPLGMDNRSDQRFIEEKLARGEVARIPDVSALPDHAAPVREDLARAGIRSFLAIPVRVEDRLVGVLGFHSLRARRDWSEQQLTVLRLVGQLFTSALQRKRSEERLRQSRLQLLQAQKMEAIGTLAGGIAHDFNNQLTVILGNGRHVLRQATGDRDITDALTDLTRAAEHCAELTRSLLAFSRRAAVSPRSVEMGRLIAENVELLRPLVPSSVAIAPERGRGDAWVEADPTQLNQVLVNLAVNARDAMPAGGRIEISSLTRQVAADESARLELDGAGDYVELSVRDTGEGMEPSVRERIFEPFFTTKPVGGGTGLGLATVYGIVRESGGAITVESTVGQGTVFRVLLPRIAPPDVSAEPDDDEGLATILLVEDESAVRRFAARTLRAAGYQVIEAENGRQALERVGQDARAIDALASDLEMPHMGGPELARTLRAQTPNLPILFLSGHAALPPECTKDVAGSPLLAKPFAEEDLVSMIRQVLRSRG